MEVNERHPCRHTWLRVPVVDVMRRDRVDPVPHDTLIQRAEAPPRWTDRLRMAPDTIVGDPSKPGAIDAG
jgi:hypothetical protein